VISAKEKHMNKAVTTTIVTLSFCFNAFAQEVEMFEKLDKNKDGEITDKEVPRAQFQKPVWKKANINGDMILSWEEGLIWQYNVQKKKAGKSK